MSNESVLWEDPVEVRDLDEWCMFDAVDVPAWIQQDIDTSDVAAIVQGGCASGAYMPAVTYATAAEVMAEHGDEVLAFIEGTYGELPAPRDGESWRGIAVHYLSMAVELWASSVIETLTGAMEARAELSLGKEAD